MPTTKSEQLTQSLVYIGACGPWRFYEANLTWKRMYDSTSTKELAWFVGRIASIEERKKIAEKYYPDLLDVVGTNFVFADCLQMRMQESQLPEFRKEFSYRKTLRLYKHWKATNAE